MSNTHLPGVVPVASFLVLSLVAGGCAIANKGEISLTRNISFGQELMDLKSAKDAGAISEDEYYHLKRKVIEMAESVDISTTVNKHAAGDDD